MYYQKESKSIPNDYYKTYSGHLKKETNSTDMLSMVIKILTIVFLLTLIIFGYIFISNQYYLSTISKKSEISRENSVKTLQENNIGEVNRIKSVEKITTTGDEKLTNRDISNIVQMVMLKMSDINEKEKSVEKKQHDTKFVTSKDMSNTSNRKVVIREVDTRSTKIKFIVVKKGDTLSTIANNVYGDKSSYKKIRDANRDIIKDTNKIFAGQRLRIPI